LEKVKQEDASNNIESRDVSGNDPGDQQGLPEFGPKPAGRRSAGDRSALPPVGSPRSREPFSRVEENRNDRSDAGGSGSIGRDVTRFQRRLTTGRVKLCSGCGGVMTRSSRMVISPLAALLLIVLGFVLMVAYGLVSNFYQAPWYMKFALPAVYYIGSIFIGVGILLFFIREKVWKCYSCREIRKR